MIFRNQIIFVLQRDIVDEDGSVSMKYYAGANAWTEDIRRAFVSPKKQAERMAKIELGLDCNLVEVIPMPVESSKEPFP